MEAVSTAAALARRAVGLEKEGKWRVAMYLYHEAYSSLQRAIAEAEEENEEVERWRRKAEEFLQRISVLNKALEEAAEAEEKAQQHKSPEEQTMDKALFLIHQALREDESGHKETALSAYSTAVHFCLQATKLGGMSSSLVEKLSTLARQSLERAEELKGIQEPIPAVQKLSLSASGSGAPGCSAYTPEEKQVLRTTSTINKIDYMPFLPSDLLQEQFNFSGYLDFAFSDPNGLLSLSPKQSAALKGWARPPDIFTAPTLIHSVDSLSIKQTIVSDCSFVASLAISANYEKRFGKKLIRSIIYPQNKAGEPVVNPFGKYMVLLRVNGVKRKVIIDDLLPVGRRGELLCSYTSRRGELWVSLLEKAYMKVMGGYDFPGSNSNIDLHALTGWIPERQSIGSDKNPSRTFYMLMKKMKEGKVLATVATGELPQAEADRAGLVPTHAYAILDIREVTDDDGVAVKLFLLKNPWSHLRWKGNYSELDEKHWTSRMKTLLNYDPDNAAMYDNGVFWIDYESIRKFFDVFYQNWDPGLFSFSWSTHKTWKSTTGPVKDVYSIAHNPQYSLELEVGDDGKGGGVVWILLTRHITDIQDFRDNREYITVLVYDSDGRKVYYPYDPPPIIDGVRINSPHYLCKLVVPAGSGRVKRYTLVVSQYEKTTTIHYTLRVYSSLSFRVGEILDNCAYKKEVQGSWESGTAGGCANYPATHLNNPTYRLELKRDGKLVVQLKAPKEYNVGFELICANKATAEPGFYKKSSGPYRPGFVVLEIPQTVAGIYNIVPCTFEPGQKGPFLLNIQATAPFDLTQLQ